MPKRLLGEGSTRRMAPVLALVAVGAMACGTPVRGRIVPDLDCGAKPGNTVGMVFHSVNPDEFIQVGHPRADDSGITSDIHLSVGSDGRMVATANERSDLTIPEPQIAGVGSNGGVEVTTGDEHYIASAAAESNGGYAVTVNGNCVPKD